MLLPWVSISLLNQNVSIFSLTTSSKLCFLYLICFLDRTNIGNAKIAHLTQDVPMSTTGYNLTLTVFFIAYAAFEALANILIKRYRPSVVLPIIMYVPPPLSDMLTTC